MILHIMHHEKFIKPFIDYINSNFNPDAHIFLITSNNEMDKIYINYKNVYFINRSRFMFVSYRKYLNVSDKVVIHGLFDSNLIITFNIFIRYLKKTYWAIWGGDLYNLESGTIQSKILSLLRHRLIKNLSHIISMVKGDYDFAIERYKSKAVFHDCIMYQSNLYKDLHLTKKNKYTDKTQHKLNILVGHSASASNSHIEIFEKLKNIKSANIFVPLSYGDENYKFFVIKNGNKILGKKFKPIIDFMNLDDYNQFLLSIDIAIFNSNRQQGLGNIITLLGMGKKVYIKSDTSISKMLIDKGIKSYGTETINLQDLSNNLIHKKNIEIVKRSFSKLNFKKGWEDIFNS